MANTTGRPQIIEVTAAIGAPWQDQQVIEFENEGGGEVYARALMSLGTDFHDIDQTEVVGPAVNSVRSGTFGDPTDEDDMMIVAYFMQRSNQSVNIEDLEISEVALDDDTRGPTDQAYTILADELTHHDDPDPESGIRFVLMAIPHPSIYGGAFTRLTVRHTPTSVVVWMVAYTIKRKGAIVDASDIEVVTGVSSGEEAQHQLTLDPSAIAVQHIACCVSTKNLPTGPDGRSSTAGGGFTEIYDETYARPSDGEGFSVAIQKKQNFPGTPETAEWNFAGGDESWAIMWHIGIPTGLQLTQTLVCRDFTGFPGIDNGKVLQGLECRINGHSAGPDNDTRTQNWRLWDDGAPIGTARPARTLPNGPPDGDLVEGGELDMWGTSLVLDDIKDPTFGVTLRFVMNAPVSHDLVMIDHIELTAHHGGAADPDIDVFKGSMQLPDGETSRLGNAWRKESTPCQITIANTGDADLDLGTLTITNDLVIDPADDPSNTTVPPKSETTVTILVGDDSVCGLKTGTLTIPSNDPDEDPWVIDAEIFLAERRWLAQRLDCHRWNRRRCGPI